jgi:hypothetical protein
MRWWRFLFTHSFFAALCASALTLQSFLHFNLAPNWCVVLWAALLTLCAYNFYWLCSAWHFGVVKNASSFLRLHKNRVVLLGIFLVALMCSFFTINLPSIPIVFAAAVAFITYFTLLLIKPPSIKWPLFIFYTLKTVALAACWVLLCAAVVLQQYVGATQQAYYYFAQVFSLVAYLCILFDRRDVALAPPQTQPFLYRAMQIGLLLCFVVLFLTSSYFLLQNPVLNKLQLITNTFLLLYCLVLQQKSNKKQSYYFYYFFVDGAMLLSALLAYLHTTFFC